MYVVQASRVCLVLSPKRLFNWSRDSFVIRRVELAGRFDAGVLLAPVSFSVPSSELPFDTAQLFSDLHGIRTGDRAWERADPVTRSGANFEYGIVYYGSYYGWCGIPLYLTLLPQEKGKSLGSCLRWLVVVSVENQLGKIITVSCKSRTVKKF